MPGTGERLNAVFNKTSAAMVDIARMLLKPFALIVLGAVAVVVAGLFSPSPIRAQDLQAELTRLSREGGGTFRLEPGASVSVPEGVVVPPHVTLDLNGGELVAVLTRGDAAGVRLMSDATLRNGTVSVVSRGSPGTQSGSHAAVLIGAMLGENPTAERISPFESPSGWVVAEVTVRSNKRIDLGEGIVGGAAGVQVMGGAHDGLIENVTVPDSDVLAGGVMLDWGVVGPVSSGEVAASRAAYGRGAAYTTHPHDIVIRGIRVGRLTRPSLRETGSFGVRVSGSHDITVTDVTVGSITEAGFLYTSGDLGYEFARPADRARANRGIVLRGMRVTEVDGGYLVRSDSYADNVGRAVADGYRAATEPIGETDIAVSNVSGTAGPRNPGFGVRVNHQRGGQFSDISAAGFKRAFYIDEQVYDLALIRPVAIDSLEAAISIEHPYRPPARITVSDPRVSGRGARARELIVGRSDDVRLAGTGNAQVRASEQARGLRRD